MKPSGPGLLCAVSFLITVSISQVVLVCLGFLLLLHSVLEGYIFLEMCPFYLCFQVSWHVVRSNFLQSFDFDGISCSLSSVISNCVSLGALSFFPDEPSKRLVDFVYLFKEPSPGFIDL